MPRYGHTVVRWTRGCRFNRGPTIVTLVRNMWTRESTDPSTNTQRSDKPATSSSNYSLVSVSVRVWDSGIQEQVHTLLVHPIVITASYYYRNRYRNVQRATTHYTSSAGPSPYRPPPPPPPPASKTYQLRTSCSRTPALSYGTRVQQQLLVQYLVAHSG